ncbi:hypothetical protein BX666DRAFT_1857470 [Dichotomocladium elegans]|nr:hypothetical protein BX666DRAFT_1857470 [Dichotomocladium elegans]
MNLSPVELHYLKRELVSIELRQEIDKLKHQLDLNPVLKRDCDYANEYPFLRYICSRFVVQFPLLKQDDESEFWIKCQQFLNDFGKIKLDTYTPRRSGASQRRILMYKLQKLMIVGLCATIKTIQGEEHSLKKTEVLKGKEEKEMEEKALASALNESVTLLENEDHYLAWLGFNGLAINVVAVRDVSERRTLREKTHAEFIISTYFEGQSEPVFVSRRHGDFRRLAQDLQTEFPTDDVPGVPRKASDALSDATDEAEPAPSHFYREQDRQLLRSFLHRIASEAPLAKSDTFIKFLTEKPIRMTPELQADADKRQEMDQARAEEEAKFREEVDRKMGELNELLDMLKKRILQPGGLIEVFNIIKNTRNVEDLPQAMRKAFEWGRINFAFVLHTQFVTSDRSAENIANLKRTHMLIPYRAIAQLLKLSNPFAMVKSILDLFLTQPFGRRSLLQRIIISSVNDGTKQVQQDIANLEAKIQDPALCQKVKNATETPITDDEISERSIRGVLSPINETLEMLKNPDIQPQLTPAQIVKLAAANDPANIRARDFVMQLHSLWTLHARQREHAILSDLIFQGGTGDLLREIFALFYQPLAQVYRAANIGDSLQHLSVFIDDLIGTIDGLDMKDLGNTTQPFVQLVQRHEQQFYNFVHQVHANDKTHLFDELLAYVDGVFALVAHGLPNRIDMDQIIANAGIAIGDPGLRKDMDAICKYHSERKAQHMKRTRQKLMMDEVEDEAFDFFPNHQEVMGVIHDLAELDEEDDNEMWLDQPEGDGAAHELTIEMPQLAVIPKIVPYFVESLKDLM